MALVTSYFGAWIGVLLIVKKLLLAEYRIQFHGFSLAVVGALVLAKVVLVLEHVPLGRWVRSQPAWIDVILRSALYCLGVLVVLLVEKGFEGRHDHGGFGPSLASVFQRVDIYHVWLNTICLSGALLGYNLLWVVRRHLGEGGLLRLFRSPVPETTEPPEGLTNTSLPPGGRARSNRSPDQL